MRISPKQLADIVRMQLNEEISSTTAKKIINDVWEENKTNNLVWLPGTINHFVTKEFLEDFFSEDMLEQFRKKKHDNNP